MPRSPDVFSWLTCVALRLTLLQKTMSSWCFLVITLVRWVLYLDIIGTLTMESCIDRGAFSCEVMLYLLLLKVKVREPILTS